MAISDTFNISKKATRSQAAKGTVKDPNHQLKQAIWLYFILLIFEGALRKWVLPGLSTPLLLIRDPVAIYLMIKANQRNLFPENGYIKGMVIIGVISIFTALAFGHGNLIVALFGARLFIIHFPIIFIIGAVFNKEDVIKMGKATLWIAVPMAVLIALQFYSPQSAWVNRGIGGDESGAGFSGALGFFRPPGTFSFTNGNALFFSFVAPFVFYFWLYPKLVNRWLLLAATAALLGSIPLSISRSLYFSILVALAFTIIGVARKPAYAKRVLGAVIGIAVLIAVLSQTSVFITAFEAFNTRFEGANESEGGVQSVLLDRYLGGLVGAVTSTDGLPFFGHGMGIGTNIGLQLLGDQVFIAPEGEWGRIIAEQGFILGMGVIIIRLIFSMRMFLVSYRKLSLGDLLPWILLSNFLLNVPQAQWKQPTTLGFSIIIGGLQLAAFRVPKKLKPKKFNTLDINNV